MMKRSHYLAFDFGASSGRAILGHFDGDRLSLSETHRFQNRPAVLAGSLVWDFVALYRELTNGIAVALREAPIRSIGIDTWGVDYGLLDSSGDLLGNVYHYRDPRSEGMMQEAFRRMSKDEIHRITGISFEKYNTLFQLLGMRTTKPDILDRAATFLLMPDLLAYFLTGEKRTEFTNATTTQLMKAGSSSWSAELLDAMDLPREMFTAIEQPCTVRGRVSKDVSEELGVDSVPVVSVATHDTASAICAVPASSVDHAFLSSGTWSLMGTEVDRPVINEQTLAWNYTNEGAVGGGYSLIKNIMGLWLVEECKREWDREGGSHDFESLVDMASSAPPFRCFLDPDDDSFYSPGNMNGKIRDFCARTGQPPPENEAQTLRCIFESLALKYRWSMERLGIITAKQFETLHILGGGARNDLLNQFTANAIGRAVVAGPAEATAVGNLLAQAMALGDIAGLAEAREVVSRSFSPVDYSPEDRDSWDESYRRFLAIA
jgi:rhamnulokinase